MTAIEKLLSILSGREHKNSFPAEAGASSHTQDTNAGGHTRIYQDKSLIGEPLTELTQVSAQTIIGPRGKNPLSLDVLAQSIQMWVGGRDVFQNSVVQISGIATGGEAHATRGTKPAAVEKKK